MFRSPAVIVHALTGLGTMLAVSGFSAPTTREANLRVVRDASPKPQTQAQTQTQARTVRADDGLFYVTGLVNGSPVRFLVDTGASVVMLTRADAERVGAVRGDQSFDASVDTANGASAMAWTTLRRISVAGRDIRTVQAAVPQSGLPVSLLGQNVLSQLGPVTLNGDRLEMKEVPAG